MCEMDKAEFENSLSVKYWMDSLNSKGGPHSTKYIWKHHLKRFCDWLDKTPDQLIEDRKQQLKNDDERVKHQAEMQLKRFLSDLEEEGLSPNTRRCYFTAVRNFYKRNYVELQFFRGDGPSTRTVVEGRRAASKEDIAKMLEVASPRVRALILFIKDTGLAESDVAGLKLKDLGVKDVSEIFTLKTPIPLILNRKKTGRRTVTFIGPESFKAVKNTLQIRKIGSPEIHIRKHSKKRRTKLMTPEVLTLESPVFRSYDKRALKTGKIKHLSPHAISVIIRRVAILAEIWEPGFSAHALRRFFQTNLETSGMNPNWIKKMMGHALKGSEEPYSQPEVEMLRDAYQKSYGHLAISETVEQKSRVEALEAQIEALTLNGKSKEAQIQKLRAQQAENVELRQRIQSTEKKLGDLEKLIRKALETAT